MMRNTPFKINHYQVMPAEFSIQADGDEKQSLQPKFIEVLCYLAENHGRVVPRSELIDHIWGQDSFVGEKSLTNAIWHLRKKLICVEGNEEVIKTIRKAGYQLLAEPQWQAITSPSSSSLNQPELVESSINYSIDSPIDNSDDSRPDNPQYQATALTTTNNNEQIKNKFKVSSTYLLLALVISLFALLYIQKPSRDEAVTVTTITKNPGSELFPAPSPDGRYVVYSQVSTNKPTNLFMKDTQQVSLAPKQLTFDDATEGHSVWSHDGQYLYFSRKNKAHNSCHYIQLKVDSQQETKLATCPMKGGYFYLDISPDDQTLAVYNKSKTAKRTGIYFIDLSSPNYQMTRFSCDSDCQYKDRDMAFSPDGKYLAVARRVNRLSENIYLINLQSKATEQLTFDEEDIVGMSWFDDSQRLVFAAQRADNRFGFIIDIANKTNSALNLAGFSYPSIAKKSQQLYYQERKEKSSLVSFQLNHVIASSPFPVLQSNFTYESPDYSAVNDLIVFSSNESGFDELWSAKPDGYNRKQLTNLKLTIRYPKWSHDGKKIAFLAPSAENKGDGIYIYSLEDERITLLKSPFSQHHRPSWSFDDSAIISTIYGQEHTDIYSINISDAKTRRITFDNARYGVMVSADTLLYTKLKRGLWQKNIKTQEASENIIDGEEFNILYAWTYNAGHIYYQKKLIDHYQLINFDIKNNVTTPLVRLPLNSISTNDSITYIPENDRLLYTNSSFPQANIKRVIGSKIFK
jgi:Tol biopolymer transport system component